MRVEEIIHADVDGGEGLLAVLIHAGVTLAPGVTFATPPEACLQLGLIRHPAGHEVAPHTHPALRRETAETQEVLFVRSGRVRADFYSPRGRFAASRELRTGDVLLLVRGWHGLAVLEEAEIVEVKNGPYMGKEKDKVTVGSVPDA